MSSSKARLRHIAISVADVAAAQKFFEDAFGMTKAGDAGRGVFMTDGTINVALLDYKGGKIPDMNNDKPLIGTIHFGMWVDDLAAAEAQAAAAGAVYLRGRPTEATKSNYEVKFRDPTGIVFDLSAGGWKGAVKEVKPAD
jgi:methylmalonyl-CoA/ethylmalonyl-CoA epimerase